MTTILSDTFETRLGTISCFLQTDKGSDVTDKRSFKLATAGHSIYCQHFDLQDIYNGESIRFESGKGWRWFIEKTNDLKESLVLYCQLMNASNETEWDHNQSENLNAVEIWNKHYMVQIGTEDEAQLEQRANRGDWMPRRYKRIDKDNNLLSWIDFGLKVTLPDLQRDENLYIHFVVATKSFVSEESRQQASNDTSLAVEQFKIKLDDRLGK